MWVGEDTIHIYIYIKGLHKQCYLSYHSVLTLFIQDVTIILRLKIKRLLVRAVICLICI